MTIQTLEVSRIAPDGSDTPGGGDWAHLGGIAYLPPIDGLCLTRGKEQRQTQNRVRGDYG